MIGMLDVCFEKFQFFTLAYAIFWLKIIQLILESNWLPFSISSEFLFVGTNETEYMKRQKKCGIKFQANQFTWWIAQMSKFQRSLCD